LLLQRSGKRHFYPCLARHSYAFGLGINIVLTRTPEMDAAI
jgi:hypothetical protein